MTEYGTSSKTGLIIQPSVLICSKSGIKIGSHLSNKYNSLLNPLIFKINFVVGDCESELLLTSKLEFLKNCNSLLVKSCPILVTSITLAPNCLAIRPQ